MTAALRRQFSMILPCRNPPVNAFEMIIPQILTKSAASRCGSSACVAFVALRECVDECLSSQAEERQASLLRPGHLLPGDDADAHWSSGPGGANRKPVGGVRPLATICARHAVRHG